MIRFFCDRCGQDITCEAKYEITSDTLFKAHTHLDGGKITNKAIICAKCFNSFQLFIGGFALESEVETK